jgi:hypothetical protein
MIPSGPDSQVLSKIKLSLAQQRPAVPAPSWKRDVLKLVLASVGFASGVAILGIGLHAFESEHVLSRLMPMALVSLAACGLAYVAIAPGNRSLRIPALVLAGIAALALVATRPAALPQSFPHWWCTVGHLGFGIVPLLVALAVLRRFAFSWWRAALAGASAGCVGALLGELGCVEGPSHVFWYHLPAWILVAGLTLVLARQRKPDSFVP